MPSLDLWCGRIRFKRGLQPKIIMDRGLRGHMSWSRNFNRVEETLEVLSLCL